MLKRLQQKWNIGSKQLLLILCVFAITGIGTAYITKAITTWSGFTDETYWLWKLLLRLAMLFVGYQVILLSVAFLFGQFPFFWEYEKKILRWFGIPVSTVFTKKDEDKITKEPGHKEQPVQQDKHSSYTTHLTETNNMQFQTRNPKPDTSNQIAQTHIAIFASGTGSNAQMIIDYFRKHASIVIGLIVSNKPQAGVLTIAEKENIPSLIIEKEHFFRGDGYVNELKDRDIQWIILAGFLWKVPHSLIKAFPGKIINIHPALLPKYGGKGMYGHFVHEAVIAAKEKQSGITIHYVDEHFDHGKHILQLICPIIETDTPHSLAKKIQLLEHKHYPAVIKELIEKTTR